MGKELKFFKYNFAVHHYIPYFVITVYIYGEYNPNLKNVFSNRFSNNEEKIKNLIFSFYREFCLSTTLNNFQINHIYH